MSDRLLFLERFLAENTDEETFVSTGEIVAAYEQNGFGNNRNNVKADLNRLRETGIKIGEKQEKNTKYYHIADRPFSTAELRMLIDIVSSSQAISKEKSDQLNQKLAGLAIAKKRSSLTARVFTADRIKTDSPEVFFAIDCIGKAIGEGKQICFHYINYLPDKRMVLRHNGQVYKVSPLAMLWNDGRYYARSIDPEKPDRVNYRIDRMRTVTIADEAAEKDPDYNPSEYAKVAHLMFDGGKKAEEITLLAENRRMINIIDKFGDKIETSIADDDHFRAIVHVIPSDTFFSWVFQFGDSIAIEGPGEVKEAYEALLRRALKRQEES